MFWLILSIVLTVVCFIFLGWTCRNKLTSLLALLCLLVMIPGFIGSVPTGYTGILTSFGKVLDDSLDAGVHFLKPWYKIVNMDNRTQKESGKTSAFSSDIQQVDIDYSVNYSIDKSVATELYRNVGVSYYSTIVAPRLQEVIKTNFGVYTAEDMIPNRMKLSTQITEDLRAEMEVYGITIVAVNIENLDFTDAFTTAVEAKQVAAQDKLRAETVQAQLTYEAEQEAQRRTIKAQADMEVANRQADAERYAKEQEALGNQALAESITEGLTQYMYAQKWNGALPQVQLDGAGSVYPVIDLP